MDLVYLKPSVLATVRKPLTHRLEEPARYATDLLPGSWTTASAHVPASVDEQIEKQSLRFVCGGRILTNAPEIRSAMSRGNALGTIKPGVWRVLGLLLASEAGAVIFWSYRLH